MMGHPDWVLKHKTKGTEIRKLGSIIISTKYEVNMTKIRNELKRSQKIPWQDNGRRVNKAKT